MAGRGVARQGTWISCKTVCHKTRRGMAWIGVARPGVAWQGKARRGVARNLSMFQNCSTFNHDKTKTTTTRRQYNG